jgi:septum formation protein
VTASAPASSLVLASASPRRAAILQALGIPFRVVVSHADETLRRGETPGDAAMRLARAKAMAVAPSESLPVVAADTIVAIGGEMLGKPGSADDAARMLRVLAGREHQVLTGLCLVHKGQERTAVETTRVRFHDMTDAEILWYVATGEPMDKAGGYHIDGRAALFIVSVDGSPSNVAGLPVRLLYALAREMGIDLTGRAR